MQNFIELFFFAYHNGNQFIFITFTSLHVGQRNKKYHFICILNFIMKPKLLHCRSRKGEILFILTLFRVLDTNGEDIILHRSKRCKYLNSSHLIIILGIKRDLESVNTNMRGVYKRNGVTYVTTTGGAVFFPSDLSV